jgi:hypothetical protein
MMTQETTMPVRIRELNEREVNERELNSGEVNQSVAFAETAFLDLDSLTDDQAGLFQCNAFADFTREQLIDLILRSECPWMGRRREALSLSNCDIPTLQRLAHMAKRCDTPRPAEPEETCCEGVSGPMS